MHYTGPADADVFPARPHTAPVMTTKQENQLLSLWHILSTSYSRCSQSLAGAHMDVEALSEPVSRPGILLGIPQRVSKAIGEPIALHVGPNRSSSCSSTCRSNMLPQTAADCDAATHEAACTVQPITTLFAEQHGLQRRTTSCPRHIASTKKQMFKQQHAHCNPAAQSPQCGRIWTDQ